MAAKGHRTAIFITHRSAVDFSQAGSSGLCYESVFNICCSSDCLHRKKLKIIMEILYGKKDKNRKENNI